MYNMLDVRDALSSQVQIAPVQRTSGLMRKARMEAQEEPYNAATSMLEHIQKYQDSVTIDEGIDTQAMSEVSLTPPEGEMRPTSRGDGGFEPLSTAPDGLAAAREAIAAVESRGSGDYDAVGPVVKKGMYKGQRAYGRYQVMEGNIGPWTEEIFGEPMSLEEFRNSPEAQDAVVTHQLQKSYERFGTFEDAAAVWFTGKPYDPDSTVSDGLTTAPEYISKFRREFNAFAGGNS